MPDTSKNTADTLATIGRLDKFGLAEGDLREAVERGMREADTCTAHDPSYVRAIMPQGKTVRHLRDILVTRGWHPVDERGYALTVHPLDLVRIAVAGGDERTGVLHAAPTTKSAKGKQTRKAVNANQLTFELLSVQKQPIDTNGVETWILLFYVDGATAEIRCELSLPTAIDDDGFVDAWRERILLRPIKRGESITHEESNDGGDELEIEVRRRSI